MPNVEASYTAYSESGYWSVYVGTENKNIDKSVNLIAKELKLLRTKLIDPIALEHAKEQLKGHIALSLDSNLEVMFNLAKNILIFNRVDSVKEIYDQIDQITANDIQNPKPHPETFLKCAELMGVNPKECMVFEDGILGMKAAAEAGMLVVDVNDYFKMEFTV